MAYKKSLKAPMSEMNVVPLVDVMLVLLVIFMVTAPMMFNGIHIKLPKTKKVQNAQSLDPQLVLSIDSTGSLYLGKEKILFNEIKTWLENENKGFAKPVFVRADGNVKYQTVAKIIAHLKHLGQEQVSLVTQTETGP